MVEQRNDASSGVAIRRKIADSSNLASVQDLDRLRRCASNPSSRSVEEYEGSQQYQGNSKLRETLSGQGRLGREWQEVADRHALLNMQAPGDLGENHKLYAESVLEDREAQQNDFEKEEAHQDMRYPCSSEDEVQNIDGDEVSPDLEDTSPSPTRPVHSLSRPSSIPSTEQLEYSPAESEHETEEQVQIYLAERRASPRTVSISEFLSSKDGILGIAPSSRFLHNSTNSPQSSNALSATRQVQARRTPPKTPYPPGAYFSGAPRYAGMETTLSRASPSSPSAIPADVTIATVDHSALDKSKSRLFGLPGSYAASPFPHPKRTKAPIFSNPNNPNRESGGEIDKYNNETEVKKVASQSRGDLQAARTEGQRQSHCSSALSPSKKISRLSPFKRLSPPAPRLLDPLAIYSMSCHPVSPPTNLNAQVSLQSPSTPEKNPHNNGIPGVAVKSGIDSPEKAIHHLISDLISPFKTLFNAVSSPSLRLPHAVSDEVLVDPVREEVKALRDQHLDPNVQRSKQRVS